MIGGIVGYKQSKKKKAAGAHLAENRQPIPENGGRANEYSVPGAGREEERGEQP